ncbi:MAG: CDP-glucose 4,6-dehydratase [Paracoccaceae bacterium]
MAKIAINSNFWKGRRVFVTGHTGFKGAWLTLWLQHLGAEVTGYALPASTTPSLHELLGLEDGYLADICDGIALKDAMQSARPEVVFHLAAQAIVRTSYDDPVATFATNVTGTAQLLEAVRHAPDVKSVVVVTSDKCYENREWPWGYRETDALGGHDPYSASKGAAEVVVASMRKSFFAPYRQDGHPARIATARAGNVIGGGDWSKDRLVPDIVRGLVQGTVDIRNPHAVRPWQHVLEPLSVYIGLAQLLAGSEDKIDAAFNIGPSAEDMRSVWEVAQALSAQLGGTQLKEPAHSTVLHEANLLTLDCALVTQKLGWRPRWRFEEAISATAQWYKYWLAGGEMITFSSAQIDAFENDTPYGKP